MLFKQIIEEQTTIENVKIYQEENLKPIENEVMLIKIQNNIITNDPYVSNAWTQRSIAWKNMINDTLELFSVQDCEFKINLGDVPKKGCFNFCRPKNNNVGFFLIPNFRFTNDNVVNNYQWKNAKGWEDTKTFIFENDTLPFDDKTTKFFFAGNNGSDIRKNYFDYMCDNLNICDGYLWNGTIQNSKLLDINKCGSKYLPYSKHFDYRYILHIDSQYAGTDRMRLLLCMNCIPIVYCSPFEEFYSYLLKDNENYISFTNIEQLKDIIKKRNIISDKKIIQNNKYFVENILTYKNILEYIANLLNKLNRNK